MDAASEAEEGWTLLAPGLRQCGVHLVLDVPELLADMGLADTAEHREAVALAVRIVVTGLELYARQVQASAPTPGAAPWHGERPPPGGSPAGADSAP